MKKRIEQQSQNFTLVESKACGLQRRITDKVDALVQRVEALEGVQAPANKQREQGAVAHASGLLHGPLCQRMDTLAASMADLDARCELLRSDNAAQLATFSMALEHQWKELGGKEFLPTDNDLQACIKIASSHTARLEKLHEKWTEMQAVQGSKTETLQEVVGDTVLRCTQAFWPFEELLPQSSEASVRNQSERSLRNRSACEPGIVNSRIQHFEPSSFTSESSNSTCADMLRCSSAGDSSSTFSFVPTNEL